MDRKRSLKDFLAKSRKINMQSDLTDKDPIMKLGYGLTAYRNIMWAMIVAFTGFTLLQIPAFLVYGTSEGYGYKPERLMGRE